MTICRLQLPMPVSVNKIWSFNGDRVTKTRAYKDWIADADVCGWQQKRAFVRFEADVKVLLEVGPRNMRRDLDNVIKPVLDRLQSWGVLRNDNLVVDIRAVWNDEVSGVLVTIEAATAR